MGRRTSSELWRHVELPYVVIHTCRAFAYHRFSECFDPMTVQIKPLEDARHAMQARKWVFSSNHESLVGRIGFIKECDKRDRSILVQHDDGTSEWWCAEALLRRVKAHCNAKHPLAEFSCDKREFTCDDCGGKDQAPYQGTMCYMYGCRMCDFDVCDRCARKRQEQILEGVEAVERLEKATAKARKAVKYLPDDPAEGDDKPTPERAIDTSNYPQLEEMVRVAMLETRCRLRLEQTLY